MYLKIIKNKKLFIPLLLVIIALLGAGAYYAYTKDSERPNPPDTGSIPTRDEITENKTIEVPEAIEEERIKEYELVVSNHEYKIRRLGDSYTITLYGIINRPDQYEMYQNQLRDYKQKALDYLSSKGVNINDIEIIYEPEEAKDL